MGHHTRRQIAICMLTVLVGALLLTGCTQPQKPVTDPAATGTTTQNNTMPPQQSDPSGDTTPSETENTVPTEPQPLSHMTAEALREQLKREGKRFAVAYLGNLTTEDDSVWAFLERQSSTTADLAFLEEIPEANVLCDTPQGEVYCILSADPEAPVNIYSESTGSGDEPVYNDIVFQGTAESPLLLVCNAAYIPDTLVEICFDDATVHWLPRLDEHCYVEGLWSGDKSHSEDGYDTLDVTPYAQVLLAQYREIQTGQYSAFEVPAEADLIGTCWKDRGFDMDGNYYLYWMELQQGVMNVHWTLQGEESEYTNAPWSFDTKDGVAVLTVDFGGFAGVKSYNLLLDKEEGRLYTAVDAANGNVNNRGECQSRYLMADHDAEPDRYIDPYDMAGTWERTHTEVEGDRQTSEPGDCIIQINVSEDDQLVIHYTDFIYPEWSYTDVWLFVIPGFEWTHFEECAWKAMVNISTFDTSHDISLLPDGTLLMVNYFTVDGAPGVSFEWFQRVEGAVG